ncbi:AAA family ATPase [Altererythrobacter luteolus]|uniref:AAA family ATPase n=2 Tax=Pontixanthobacter luteolus TaxID=295089 RepID=A0A6I4V163_9SPHN|nr:AAA family ATPase [Pontixanthobacter luteolus]
MSIIYAENGRGKTTMAAILRSLSSGDPKLISDRHRVGAANPPHIVLEDLDGAQHAFQNGAWSAPLSDLVVFDDAFVAENVCSGIEIEAGHRQNLHELILGAQGVALNSALQGHIAAIEEHNRQLRQKEAAIPAIARFGLAVDEFCALQDIEDVDASILDAERALAAAQSGAAVQTEPEFDALILPAFDIDGINALLARGMEHLDADAAAQVQTHLAQIGTNGERWVSDGVVILSSDGQPWAEKSCPFCAQPLNGSQIIDHYRAFFSAEYTSLKADLAAASGDLTNAHSGEVQAAFEREVGVATQRRAFWLRFLEVPEFAIDTAEFARAWKAARDAVQAALNAKRAAPLDAAALDTAAITAIEAFHVKRDEIAAISDLLVGLNGQIAIVKEQAQAANVAALTTDLNRLKATSSRHSEQIAPRCNAYLAERAAKQETETARDNARIALDNYRQNIFPTYEASINNYLGRFNAGFRLGGVSPVNNRVGSSATYNVVINNVDVPLAADAGPSFRTALSAGDRNTLALAFFFASLHQSANLANAIVVIDDPMTSLDEHRSLVTVQEIRRLLDRVRQVIVLSHSKPFLIALWKVAPRDNRSALRIARAAVGSIIEAWDVNHDSITEHDHRFARAMAYVQNADPAQERTVAADLRYMIEAFLRVAYANHFPPGSMVGRFWTLCDQRIGTANQILSLADTEELRAILDFANRYHHDTNPTYQTEDINDAELVNFASRTLTFIRRS